MKKLWVLVCFGCVCAAMLPAQELQKGVQNAVANLAMGFVRQIEVSIGEMALQGKNTKSDFSLYLHNLVNEYVNKNSSVFKVVKADMGIRGRPKQSNEPQRGIITGTYVKRNDKVEVFLNLISDPDGKSLGSQRFTFPFAELSEDEQKSFLEPANSAVIEKQEQIFTELSGTAAEKTNTPPVSANPANQGIKIQAFFNSQSMTYMHADELKMTVFAGQDCYFKIIHINVDNQIKMIFPTKNDNNNFLRANESRDVFGRANNRQILCEPYGAETLVVVASPVQFPNIEKEYSEPWKAATEATIKAAIAGAGQARYSITILKPHEEYEYAKPENMTELYQGIRDDAARQNGYFEGNDKSGFYIIDNVRGSYRVPSDRPDIIQFASYTLDKYTADSYRSGRTRGSAYDFKFAKPQNMSQAVQTVRSSIMEKGGTFDGNEQQGNFRASGIAGKYQVADVVNVTISEKPFVIPNSLIENEVKKYFGVR